MSESQDDKKPEAGTPLDAPPSESLSSDADTPKAALFKRTFLQNIGWSAIGMGLRVLFAGGTLALLSRLVDPGTMGLYGVAWAASALGYNVGRSGAAQGIIALPNMQKQHLGAAQFLSAALALGMCLSLIVAAPAVEAFYGMEGLGHAFVIGGLFVPLMCLPCVDMALAQKELNFGRLAIFQTIGVVLASLTAIGFALAGYGLLSLFALQGFIGPYTFILFRLARQPLGLSRFRMSHVKAVWGIGGHLSLTGVTVVIMQNVPQLIMAKFLSAETMGYYIFSYRIVQLIGQQLGGMVGMVVYPTFSAIQSDLRRIGEAYIASARYTVFALFLCLLVLVVAPGPFLDLYGGDQWESSKNVLLFLAVMQMLMSLGSNVFPTFQAIGRPEAGWQWSIFVTCIQAIIVFSLARYGVEAIAQGLAVGALITPLAPYLLSRAAGFSFAQYVRSMTGILLPVVPAIALGIALQYWTKDLPSLLAFSIPACSAGLFFLGLTITTDKDLRQNLGKIVAVGRKRFAAADQSR